MELNIRVYTPLDQKEVDDKIIEKYKFECDWNKDIDEDYKKALNNRKIISITRSWHARVCYIFEKIKLNVSAKYRWDNYETVDSGYGKTQRFKDDDFEIYVTENKGVLSKDQYKPTYTRHTGGYSVRKDEVYLWLDKSGYWVNQGNKMPYNMKEESKKVLVHSWDEVPDYVNKNLVSRLKNYNVCDHLDEFQQFAEDFYKGKGVIEHTISVDEIKEAELRETRVFIYPIYRIEVAYEDKQYYIDDINYGYIRMDTEPDHTAKHSQEFEKNKRRNRLAKLTAGLLIAFSIILSVACFVGIISIADGTVGVKATLCGMMSTTLLMKFTVIDISSLVMVFFVWRKRENNKIWFQRNMRRVWTFNAIHFTLSLLILIVSLVAILM